MSIANIWPEELASDIDQSYYKWSQPNSNIALDFHGDFSKAKLSLLSDGNHHMALQISPNTNSTADLKTSLLKGVLKR